MTDYYWVGNGASTDFNTAANWATESAGAGGAGIPGTGDIAYFDINSSGACQLDANLSVGGFNFNANPGTFSDMGYDTYIYRSIYSPYSGFSAVFTGDTYIVEQGSDWSRFGNTNQRLEHVIVNEDVNLRLDYYFHVKKWTHKARAQVTESTSWAILVPTADEYLIIEPSGSIPQLRVYIYGGDRRQSGFGDGQIVNLWFPYGSAGTQAIMDADLTITGNLYIHSGSGSKTEETARNLDMNGYNLTCHYIILGQDGPTYDGYSAKISFGTGTHNIYGMTTEGKNEYGHTYPFVDWGSGEINALSYMDMGGYIRTYVHDDHKTRINLWSSNTQRLVCSGDQTYFPDIYVQKNGGEAQLQKDLYCTDLNMRGDRAYWNANGYDVYMPQRVFALRKLGLKGRRLNLIGKKWVNG